MREINKEDIVREHGILRCKECGCCYDQYSGQTHKARHNNLMKLEEIYGSEVVLAARDNEEFKKYCRANIKNADTLNGSILWTKNLIMTYWVRAICALNYNSKLSFEMYAAMYLKSNKENIAQLCGNATDYVYSALVNEFGLMEGLKENCTGAFSTKMERIRCQKQF